MVFDVGVVESCRQLRGIVTFDLLISVQVPVRGAALRNQGRLSNVGAEKEKKDGRRSE